MCSTTVHINSFAAQSANPTRPVSPSEVNIQKKACHCFTLLQVHIQKFDFMCVWLLSAMQTTSWLN